MVALRIRLMHKTQRISACSSLRRHPASTSHGRFTSTSNRTSSMRCALAATKTFSTRVRRPCPLDSRTPVSVPDGSPRTHSQGHARPGSPCTHAISPRSRTLHPMHAYTCPLDASCVHRSAVCI
ncbi:hypothetical protein BJV77DRAFT_1000420, partial [Russula vinacea]